MEYALTEQYWIWLSAAVHLSPRQFYALLTAAGDARAIWDDPKTVKGILDEKSYASLTAARNERTFFRVFALLEKSGIRAVTRINDLYPTRLATIVDAPPTLFIKGNPDLNPPKPFAIVGTRNASHEGRKTANEFSQALARQGVCVVSGLARGIDTCAHSGCIAAGGRTIAVLGGGVNYVTPIENEKLACEIVESGGSVVSEMRPEDAPQKWSFPARNRIISGLSAGVLVVEGRRTSGALITADYALDQSRDVFAVPGSIYSPMSEGTNFLIQNGAYPALSPWDILESERWGSRPDSAVKEKPVPEMNEDEKKIFEKLALEPLTFDEIANSTGYSAQVLNSHLTMMILRGIIVKTPGNVYRVN